MSIILLVCPKCGSFDCDYNLKKELIWCNDCGHKGDNESDWLGDLA